MASSLLTNTRIPQYYCLCRRSVIFPRFYLSVNKRKTTASLETPAETLPLNTVQNLGRLVLWPARPLSESSKVRLIFRPNRSWYESPITAIIGSH